MPIRKQRLCVSLPRALGIHATGWREETEAPGREAIAGSFFLLPCLRCYEQKQGEHGISLSVTWELPQAEVILFSFFATFTKLKIRAAG